MSRIYHSLQRDGIALGGRFQRWGRYPECAAWFQTFQSFRDDLEELDKLETQFHPDRLFHVAALLEELLKMKEFKFCQSNDIGPHHGDLGDFKPPKRDCLNYHDVKDELLILSSIKGELIRRYKQRLADTPSPADKK